MPNSKASTADHVRKVRESVECAIKTEYGESQSLDQVSNLLQSYLQDNTQDERADPSVNLELHVGATLCHFRLSAARPMHKLL